MKTRKIKKTKKVNNKKIKKTNKKRNKMKGGASLSASLVAPLPFPFNTTISAPDVSRYSAKYDDLKSYLDEIENYLEASYTKGASNRKSFINIMHIIEYIRKMEHLWLVNGNSGQHKGFLSMMRNFFQVKDAISHMNMAMGSPKMKEYADYLGGWGNDTVMPNAGKGKSKSKQAAAAIPKVFHAIFHNGYVEFTAQPPQQGGQGKVTGCHLIPIKGMLLLIDHLKKKCPDLLQCLIKFEDICSVFPGSAALNDDDSFLLLERNLHGIMYMVSMLSELGNECLQKLLDCLKVNFHDICLEIFIADALLVLSEPEGKEITDRQKKWYEINFSDIETLTGWVHSSRGSRISEFEEDAINLLKSMGFYKISNTTIYNAAQYVLAKKREHFDMSEFNTALKTITMKKPGSTFPAIVLPYGDNVDFVRELSVRALREIKHDKQERKNLELMQELASNLELLTDNNFDERGYYIKHDLYTRIALNIENMIYAGVGNREQNEETLRICRTGIASLNAGREQGRTNLHPEIGINPFSNEVEVSEIIRKKGRKEHTHQALLSLRIKDYNKILAEAFGQASISDNQLFTIAEQEHILQHLRDINRLHENRLDETNKTMAVSVVVNGSEINFTIIILQSQFRLPQENELINIIQLNEILQMALRHRKEIMKDKAKGGYMSYLEGLIRSIANLSFTNSYNERQGIVFFELLSDERFYRGLLLEDE